MRRRRATCRRASASTPSTSSSRPASAFRPSPTWTCTRRSSPPRSRRRAARTPRGPRRPSALVLVVAAPPEAVLVAAQRRAIEPLVHPPEAVQPARVRGVGVVDGAVLARERAQARPLARERLPVRAGAGGDRPLAGLHLAGRPRRPLRRPVVVVDLARAL